MKKILALSCMVFSTIFATRAGAQTLYVGAIGGSTVSTIYVNEIFLTMTSRQKVGTTTLTASNDLTAFTDNAIEPIGNIYYWDAPSSTTGLSFNIGAGYYVTVTNTGSTPQTVHVTVRYSPYDAAQSGTYMTVLAGATVNLPVPVGGRSYSTSGEFGGNDPTYGYPFPIQVLVAN